MALFKKIRSWWLGLFRKRRFNMLNATDNSEEWHIHLSPASIFAALVAFLLLLDRVIPHLHRNACPDTAPRPTVRARASCRTSSASTRWSACSTT